MSEPNARLFKLLRIYCKATAIAVVGLACVVGCGWAFHIETLTTVFPGHVTMKANTAMGLGLSGISLWLVLTAESRVATRWTARFLASLVALLGAATLSEYSFGFNLRIDEFLITDANASLAAAHGRMAPTTALAFVAVGLALVLLDWKTRRGRRPAQALSLLSLLIAMMTVAGFIYHATALYKLLFYTQIAMQTSIALSFLSAAVFFARPHDGIAGEITGEGSGSVMARRFLPVIFCVPILLGWICLRGQTAGIYRTEFGLAIYATATVIVFAILVWLSARKMNAEYRQRSIAEIEIRAPRRSSNKRSCSANRPRCSISRGTPSSCAIWIAIFSSGAMEPRPCSAGRPNSRWGRSAPNCLRQIIPCPSSRSKPSSSHWVIGKARLRL
jgi:hypothetical protein